MNRSAAPAAVPTMADLYQVRRSEARRDLAEIERYLAAEIVRPDRLARRRMSRAAAALRALLAELRGSP